MRKKVKQKMPPKKISIAIQNVSGQRIPSHEFLKSAVFAVLNDKIDAFSLCIRIVDQVESASLNYQYRKKEGSTNVLAFPSHEILADNAILLGDIVVCASVVKQEAKQQQKTFHAHFAHMIVHGCLHLLGFDHQTDKEEYEMQAVEIQSLKRIGLANPYQGSL